MSSFSREVLFIGNVALLHCVFSFLCEGAAEQMISVYENSRAARFCEGKHFFVLTYLSSGITSPSHSVQLAVHGSEGGELHLQGL